MAELELSDLYALSALREQGFKPLRTASDGRRCVWVFEATPELRTALEAFFGREMKVDALGFSERVRAAKSEVHALRA